MKGNVIPEELLKFESKSMSVSPTSSSLSLSSCTKTINKIRGGNGGNEPMLCIIENVG